MFAAFTLAAAVLLPPDGAYTYGLKSGGTTVSSVVSVSHEGAGIVVRERATVNGTVIQSWRTFDAALNLSSYRAQSPGGDAEIAFEPSRATLKYAGQRIDYALPAEKPALVVDGLLATAAMLPAFVATHRAHDFAILTTMNPRVLDVTVDADAHPMRPDGLPSRDIPLTIVLADAPQTIWYDPTTYVVDEFDPAPGVKARLESHTSAISASTPAPTPTPLRELASSREVTFTSADGSSLAGTISYPNERARNLAGIVLVAGSGTHDRNEAIGALHPFYTIAEGLNASGFAVLRYDKRFAGASTSATSAQKVTRQSYVDDVLAAVNALRADPRIDPNRIYLLGHSEGGEEVIAAQLQGAHARGLILLAPLSVPYETALEDQVGRGLATQETVDALERANAMFFASWKAVDPRTEITRVDVPILVVHGSEDVNVSSAELAELTDAAMKAHRRLTVMALTGDDHLFSRTDLPFDPRVIQALTSWLDRT